MIRIDFENARDDGDEASRRGYVNYIERKSRKLQSGKNKALIKTNKTFNL